MIDFHAYASIRPDEMAVQQLRDPYLQSGVPAAFNLLEPLSHDPVLQGPVPRLAASRLSLVQPLNRNMGRPEVNTYRSPVNTFRAVPPLSTRIHYIKSKNNGRNASLVASLDIETAPFSSDSIELKSVRVTLTEGASVDLVAREMPKPWICRPKDIAVYLFRLTLNSILPDGVSPSAAQTVAIEIDATILISDTSKPTISMRWKTGVDFSAALNPIYGAPGQSMQRSRRPSSLAMRSSSSQGNGALSISAQTENQDTQSQSSTESLHRQRALSVSDLGVTITFAAPPIVDMGKPFTWSIVVINGSRRPRRLKIVVIPTSQRRRENSHSSQASAVVQSDSHDGFGDKPVIEQQVFRDLRQDTKSGLDGAPQILCLDSDLQLESLSPGASVDAELRFIALAAGALAIAAVRVTDMVSGDAVDVRDLPDVICKEVSGGNTGI